MLPDHLPKKIQYNAKSIEKKTVYREPPVKKTEKQGIHTILLFSPYILEAIYKNVIDAIYGHMFFDY